MKETPLFVKMYSPPGVAVPWDNLKDGDTVAYLTGGPTTWRYKVASDKADVPSAVLVQTTVSMDQAWKLFKHWAKLSGRTITPIPNPVEPEEDETLELPKDFYMDEGNPAEIEAERKEEEMKDTRDFPGSIAPTLLAGEKDTA